MKKIKSEHEWKFVQVGGMIQASISTIDDILNLDKLDQKYWTVLSCPVNGLEFSEETLGVIDSEKKGKVSIPDILRTVDYIKKYFANPSEILDPADFVFLNDLSDAEFTCGVTAKSSAKQVLEYLGKNAAEQITYQDVNEAIKVLSEKKMDSSQIIKKECLNNKAAADCFMKIKDKIDEYFLKCSIIQFDESSKDIFKAQWEALISAGNISALPIILCDGQNALSLNAKINPLWKADMDNFANLIVKPLFGNETTEITPEQWKAIKADFSEYVDWFKKDVDNPLISACQELKKLILLRRDFYELLQNFVSFERFYNPDEWAVFQYGTLYIDGRSCDLCFKVLDIAKHGTMAALSQCFLIYCDCVKQNNRTEKMQIAALISNGDIDNLIVGRNGIFYDRKGITWDATIVKIIENPISIRQAFWSPYKRLSKMIQEKLAKSTSDAEKNIFDKMAKSVDNPNEIKNNIPAKKTDVGTVAAISVAFTGIATVVGGILQAFLGLGFWIPLGIIGIILIISLPSMLIAWRKLRQRNISPILDASGWAINGNVKIPTLLGTSLTKLPARPASAYLSAVDPFKSKKHPFRTAIIWIIVIVVVGVCVYLGWKNPEITKGCWNNLKSVFNK